MSQVTDRVEAVRFGSRRGAAAENGCEDPEQISGGHA